MYATVSQNQPLKSFFNSENSNISQYFPMHLNLRYSVKDGAYGIEMLA